MMEGPGAESEEKREPVSDIETAAVDQSEVLDPHRPIREEDLKAMCSAGVSVGDIGPSRLDQH